MQLYILIYMKQKLLEKDIKQFPTTMLMIINMYMLMKHIKMAILMMFGEGSSFLINHEDIDKILFRGYDSEEREKFLDELSKMYDEQ